MLNQIPSIEIFEGIVNAVVSILFILGLALTLLLYKKKKSQTTVFLILLMLSGFLYSFSNIFEKFELWERADEFGDPFIMFFATILLIIGLVVILEEKLQTSERNYRKALIRTNFYKDLFSHDMSNIVQNIKSSLELYSVLSEIPEKKEDTENILDVIREQSTRGAELISNVRKLSKMEDSEKGTKPVDVSTVLDDTVSYVKRGFQNKDVRIQIIDQAANTTVYANEFLTDVIENLLINAVFHNENSIKEITIRISEEENENFKFIKLEFIDNGMGISDARKNAIFQRNFNQEKKTRGMGIGLSLVKEIIDTYNGEITVEDKIKGDYSKGSIFILKLHQAS
jgi:signal transduction histidine kinase